MPDPYRSDWLQNRDLPRHGAQDAGTGDPDTVRCRRGYSAADRAVLIHSIERRRDGYADDRFGSIDTARRHNIGRIGKMRPGAEGRSLGQCDFAAARMATANHRHRTRMVTPPPQTRSKDDMKKAILAAFAGVAFLALAGCNDGGGQQPPPAPAPEGAAQNLAD